jgi:hypothetical protein
METWLIVLGCVVALSGLAYLGIRAWARMCNAPGNVGHPWGG